MNLPFDLNLSGKTAVVTGAGGVLCSMFAKVLAQCGAKTAILDLNLEAAQKVADEITAEGYAAKAYKANVLDKEVMEEVHKAVLTDFGPCDILINGAGGNNPRATTANEYYFPGDIDKDIANFFNLDKDGVSFVFNLNFLGTLIPTQVFAQDMLTREGCNILNIFTQWLAVHFSKVGIRVNAIAPGFFVTKQNQALLFNEDGTPTPRTGKILAATPMERFGKPEELVGALMFLLNNAAASFVTGVVIPVDGGFSAYSGV